MYFVHRSVCRDFVLAFVLCVICAVCPLCPCQCERCPGRDLGHHSREVGKTKAVELSAIQSPTLWSGLGELDLQLVVGVSAACSSPPPPPAGEFLPAVRRPVLSTPRPHPSYESEWWLHHWWRRGTELRPPPRGAIGRDRSKGGSELRERCGSQ